MHLNKGPIARPTTQHLPHPIKAPRRQHVSQLSPLARQLMDPGRRSGDQAHEGRFIPHRPTSSLGLERALKGMEGQLRSEAVGWTCTKTTYPQWKTCRRAGILLKRSQSYWARFKLPYAPPLLLHYHHKADEFRTDRPREPGRIHEPGTLGCRAGKAD